jgi:hypothetical protein
MTNSRPWENLKLRNEYKVAHHHCELFRFMKSKCPEIAGILNYVFEDKEQWRDAEQTLRRLCITWVNRIVLPGEKKP